MQTVETVSNILFPVILGLQVIRQQAGFLSSPSLRHTPTSGLFQASVTVNKKFIIKASLLGSITEVNKELMRTSVFK